MKAKEMNWINTIISTWKKLRLIQNKMLKMLIVKTLVLWHLFIQKCQVTHLVKWLLIFMKEETILWREMIWMVSFLFAFTWLLSRKNYNKDNCWWTAHSAPRDKSLSSWNDFAVARADLQKIFWRNDYQFRFKKIWDHCSINSKVQTIYFYADSEISRVFWGVQWS